MDKYTVLFYETRKQQIEVQAESEQDAVAQIMAWQKEGKLKPGEICGTDYDVLDSQPIRSEGQRQYVILQLNRTNSVYAFCHYSFLQQKGVKLDASCYDSVYKGIMVDGMNLESLYAMFNINRPEDFKGHSLSVSDVIVLHDGASKTAHFVDSFGFKELPDFFDTPVKAKESPEIPANDTVKRTVPNEERT